MNDRSVNPLRKINYPENNLLINSCFDHWRRGTSFTTTNVYNAERWRTSFSHGASISIDRDADVPIELYDVNYSLKYTVTTGSPTTAAQFSLIEQRIEGNVFRNVIGKYVTVSFWVKSNVTGIFTASLMSGSNTNNRYTFEYTINQADTWERKYKTIFIDSAIPFGSGASWGASLFINLKVGTDYHGLLDQWVTNTNWGSSNAVDFMATTSNYLKITGVMISEGDKLFPFARRGLNDTGEISLCNRYFTGNDDGYRHHATYLNTSTIHCDVDFPEKMRVTPTIETYYGSNNGVVRSLNSGALPAAVPTGLVSSKGFGRIDSAALFVAGNQYHFAFRADAEL